MNIVCSGILAADESTGTMGKRLAGLGLENVEENRYKNSVASTRQDFSSGFTQKLGSRRNNILARIC